MPSKIWGSLKQRTSTAKFYYFVDSYTPYFRNRVHTAQYLSNWMWIYEQIKNKKSNPNANHMNIKYQVSRDDVLHPEECKWVEVTGLNLDDLESFSSNYDSFSYQSDTKPQMLREFPLTTFSCQLAELLY